MRSVGTWPGWTTCLPAAEDEDALVVRLHETTGRSTRATLTFEHVGPEMPVVVDLGANEVKTLLITGDAVAEADLLERKL